MRARGLDVLRASDGRTIAQLEIDKEYAPQVQKYVDGLRDKEIDIALKVWRNPRSKEANSYSWVLTDKLADVMLVRGVHLTKEEMHAEMIFRYGQPAKDSDGNLIIISVQKGVKAPEWFPYLRDIGEGAVGDKEFVHYRAYRGSHTYDSYEMSVFIAGIVSDCKEQGIETMTPNEIAEMMTAWRSYEK